MAQKSEEKSTVTSSTTTTTTTAAASGLRCCLSGSAENSIGSIDIESPPISYQITDNNNETILTSNTLNANFPKRPTVDLEFQNVKYTVGKFSLTQRKYERKEILHGVNGVFRSGQLTAIMGPSGAGKSTLLNILAGYVETGVTGNIQVNGKQRPTNSKTFRNISAYIHQDDALRPYLTVGETMCVAVNLKLGYKVTKEYKKEMVHNILVLLGLEKRINTFTYCLSGGQKKRLAIALEMINNPPIIFLDEPTTGLDSSSCTRCISLLKRLAQEGRTIICTIHQPSALIFEMFDKLYGLAQGNCIYQGPVKQLVPFMGDLGLTCPSYHNPADFLMEIAIGDYDVDLNRLIESANKKYYEERDDHHLYIKDITNTDDISILPSANEKGGLISVKTDPFFIRQESFFTPKSDTKYSRTESASIIMQYFLLSIRHFTATRRNTFLIIARVAAHIFIASLFGYLYVHVGPSATTVLANYAYLYGTILLIAYTGKMSVVLSFPLEMEILKREHFNQWYKLVPYYLSIITFEIPFQMFCAWLYVVISYHLTGNYYEDYRYYYFVLMCLLATICAQSWGFFIGTTLPIKLAVFIGPILIVLFSVFGFCTTYLDITPMLRWMWHISYFRAGFHGIISTVYGMDRPYLDCPDTTIYCHFKNPKKFLEQMLIDESNISDNITLMVGTFFVMHILTIIFLWLKLNKR